MTGFGSRRTAVRRPLSSASTAAVTALSVAALAAGTSPLAAAECSGSLKCRHNTKCADGDAEYGFLNDFPHLPFLSTTNVDGEHCECHEDRTAVDCGTKIMVCNTDSGFPCLNNGECGETKKGKDICDCSTAHKDGKTKFAGTHCEFEATDVCEAEDDGLETETWFCANKGVCRDNESDINKKCNCPKEWTGPHCEFPADSESAPKPETCTLQCENGGQCKHGTKEDNEKLSKVLAAFGKEIDGMHCVCPEGYTGLTCDVQFEKCGNFHCFHGSKCIKGDDGKRHCDCNTANAKKKGKSYAGEFCEHGATSFCPPVEGKPEGSMFCTNGGKCNKSEPHKGCECSGTGHEGPLCEYSGGTEPDCTLNCKNGGQCRHGINPEVAGILGTKFDLSLKTHSGFMHCSCPEGFLGVDCGVVYEICGPKEELNHACANGGKCIITGQNNKGKNKYACDCGKMNPFAGQHCEHPATQFCAKSEEGEKKSYHSFCTNGGKCNYSITPEDPHPGCDCPDEWEGDHCQYKFGTTPIEEFTAAIEKKGKAPEALSSGGSGGGGGGGAMVGIAIATTVLAVVAIVGLFVYTRMRRAANANGAVKAKGVNLAPAATACDAEDNRPGSKISVNLEGQMHDVEII